MSKSAHEPSAQPNVDSPATATADEDLLAALADEFTARLRRGEHPKPDDFVERHPALAERIRKVFQAVILMEQSRTIDVAGATESVGATIGRYKLLERIGEGGFGVVYMAEQQHPVRRKVALKVVKPGMDSRQVLARFEAERQALAIMDHLNIAKVLDAGATDSGRPYFVMELVKGEPITEFCDAHQLPPRERLELFLQVCHAVQHAHQKGIIHRDIKPTNVLVAVHDTTPVVKVIDFGVAKALGQELTDKTLFTGFAQLVGTPLYMSPEQAGHSSLDVDTRSDIYSLGVLLYELLTGTTPFDKERFKQAAQEEIRRIIREEEPPTPSTRLSDSKESLPSISALRRTEPAKLTRLVRGELDWIVMKALEKDRNRRYEMASGFAIDVRRYLAGEAVQAVPPSPAYRVKKFVRRNKGPLLAASLVLLTLVAGIVGTAWQAVRAERARQAEAERAEGERRAKERAEANFAIANEAVETYLGTLTNEPGLKRADFHPLRKTLLESAIPFLEKLTAQESDDPEVEARRGKAYDRLSSVRRAMGEHEAALRDSESALAIFVRLSTDFPTVPAYRYELASNLNTVGVRLARLGKRPKAETLHRRAQDILQKLTDEFPDEPKYRQSLANKHNNLGILLDDLGQNEEAEALFRKAIAIGEKLAEEFPLKGSYRDELAGSHTNLGILLSAVGKNEDAEKAYRRALDLRANLAASVPASPGYREHLAQSQLNLGTLLDDRRKHEEAEALFREAIANWEKLAKDFPTVPEYRAGVVKSLNNLGNALRAQSEYVDAEVVVRQAVDIQEKLAAEFRKVPAYRRDLFAVQSTLGNVLLQLGKRPEAEEAYRQAVVTAEGLAREFADVRQHAVDLGGAYGNFGNVLRNGGQPEVALDWYRKAIATLEPVVTKESRLVVARQFLCNSHLGRASAFEALGRHDEATSDWERTVELDDGRNKANFRLRMFRSQKDAAGCLAAAAEYEAQKPTDAGELYDAACNRAVCAAVIPQDPKTPAADAARLAKEQADLAMDWLRQAVAAGFRDVEHMKQDKDLDVLREREDFNKLFELQAKKEKAGVKQLEK